MKEMKYIRQGATIHHTDAKGTKYESINQAKKASHMLQMNEDGALGRGSLQVAR